MEIMKKHLQLNPEKIHFLYLYDEFSIIITRKGKFRTCNRILTKVINKFYNGNVNDHTLENILTLAYQNYEWKQYTDQLAKIFNNLVKERILIEAKDLNTELSIILYDNRETIWPMHIAFEVTRRCNFNCKFCYNDFTPQSRDLSIIEIRDIFSNLRKHGLKSVELTGGEVFTRKEPLKLIKTIYEYVDQIFILTNGYNLDEDRINELLKLNNKLKIFGLSLHYADEDKFDRTTGVNGSFKKVIKNIKNLKQKGFLIRIACPVIEQNYDDLLALCELVDSLDINQLQFGINMQKSYVASENFISEKEKINNWLAEIDKKFPNLNIDTTRKEIDIAQKTVDIIGCGGFSKNLELSPSGVVRPCLYFPEDSIYSIGELNESTLSGKKMKIIQKVMSGSYNLDGHSINDICSSCKNYEICGKCFYVKSVLNQNNNNCKLVTDHNFKFEEILEDYEKN